MRYVEFLVFLCRITHEHYESTKNKREPLYVKLDHQMEHFLARVNIAPAYKAGEMFATERNYYMKLYRRKKRALLK